MTRHSYVTTQLDDRRATLRSLRSELNERRHVRSLSALDSLVRGQQRRSSDRELLDTALAQTLADMEAKQERK